MQENPIDQFIEWFKEASSCSEIEYPEAMSFSTIYDGYPDSRIVLLKHVDKQGFVFYSNYNSAKGKALEVNPNASMLFYWEKLKRQVRIRGTVEKTQSNFVEPLLNTFVSTGFSIANFLKQNKNKSITESPEVTKTEKNKTEINKIETTDILADAYFKSRPRDSQVGAWASEQSEEIESNNVLKTNVKVVEKKFDKTEVTRPPHWGGYRLVPTAIEFWSEKRFRLHDRVFYIKGINGEWKKKLLSP